MRLRESYAPGALWRGARDNLGIGVAVSGYGAVFGVLTAGKGIALADMVAMNLFIFAGAAQFLIVEMWTPTAVVAEIILAALIINLRYLLVGASLRPVFTGRPLHHKALGMHLVADENWAVTMNGVARAGGATGGAMPGPAHLLGGGLCLAAFWHAASAAGHVAGNFLPEPRLLGLDFAFTAVFLALALGLWKGRGDLLPWIITGATAWIAAEMLPGKWYVLIAAAAGFAATVVQHALTGGAGNGAEAEEALSDA
ncbi:AzlC family ABC transporter permease [Caenispirillum salinarum]|uniref:AzlC family ABC transporter permease n=1 Tax=Caenispirillum salinarum TaxID=859058 RepID=UPI00384F0B26